MVGVRVIRVRVGGQGRVWSGQPNCPIKTKPYHKWSIEQARPMSVSDVPRSLKSWVSTTQSVVLTADVFQLKKKHHHSTFCLSNHLRPSPNCKQKRKTYHSTVCLSKLRPSLNHQKHKKKHHSTTVFAINMSKLKPCRHTTAFKKAAKHQHHQQAWRTHDWKKTKTKTKIASTAAAPTKHHRYKTPEPS